MILSGEFGVLGESLNPPMTSIQKNTRRINLIVRRMLAFLRDLEMEPFDIVELVASIADSDDVWLATRRNPDEVTVTAVHGNGIVIEADKGKVETAVFELIHNAIKFTSGGGEVTVSVVEDDEECVVVVVGDTGIGIARKDHQRIFEPFVQLRMDMARPFEGTGTGLSVVKSIAERHGGYVDVASAPGDGSVFRLVLPKK